MHRPVDFRRYMLMQLFSQCSEIWSRRRSRIGCVWERARILLYRLQLKDYLRWQSYPVDFILQRLHHVSSQAGALGESEQLTCLSTLMSSGHQAFLTNEALYGIAETTLGNLKSLSQNGTSENLIEPHWNKCKGPSLVGTKGPYYLQNRCRGWIRLDWVDWIKRIPWC